MLDSSFPPSANCIVANFLSNDVTWRKSPRFAGLLQRSSAPSPSGSTSHARSPAERRGASECGRSSSHAENDMTASNNMIAFGAHEFTGGGVHLVAGCRAGGLCPNGLGRPGGQKQRLLGFESVIAALPRLGVSPLLRKTPPKRQTSLRSNTVGCP
jgi:hypothetical protein